MKKALAIFLFCICMTEQLSAYRYYVDCSGYASMKEKQTEMQLLPYYKALGIALKALKEAYELYQEQLKEQNRLYEQLTKLKKENTKTDAHKQFLLQKSNKLIGNTIDNAATLKDIK